MAIVSAEKISTLRKEDALEIGRKTLESVDSDSDLPSSNVIVIEKFKLQELWCKGILNDLSYTAFALELHDKPSLDLQQFSREWTVEDLSESQLDDGWKAKKLKVRSILNAICILDDKGVADCNFSAQVNQLSLFE
jgi:hypothetical protein